MRYNKIALLLIALPGLNSFGGFNSKHGEVEHVQGAIQLAQVRELMGSDSIRFTSAHGNRVEQINQFVSDYSARSLKGGTRAQSRKVAQAIIDSSLRHGFDPLLLVAVIENESRFDPTVVGTHGEIGLMQIKPDTAEWIAKKSHIRWKGASSLTDPVANIRLGAAYLSMLRTQFGFDKDLYLSAYNMGARSLSRMLLGKTRPRIYREKTIEHYSKLYVEFMAAQAPVYSGPYASL